MQNININFISLIQKCQKLWKMQFITWKLQVLFSLSFIYLFNVFFFSRFILIHNGVIVHFFFFFFNINFCIIKKSKNDVNIINAAGGVTITLDSVVSFQWSNVILVAGINTNTNYTCHFVDNLVSEVFWWDYYFVFLFL
jgi:hypothetical protein